MEVLAGFWEEDGRSPKMTQISFFSRDNDTWGPSQVQNRSFPPKPHFCGSEAAILPTQFLGKSRLNLRSMVDLIHGGSQI
jgi:hypothetical protein